MKLKQLIDRHRDDFDQEAVPAGLWTQIEPQLAKQEGKRTRLAWYSAAAAILIASFAWWQWPEPSQSLEPAQLPNSFISLEKDYQQNLAQIEAMIPLDRYRDDPEYQWVFDELQELESINQHYRQDVAAPVPREELLKVLIDYYEKRLRLIRKLQMEIERNQKLSRNENFNL